MLSSFKVILFCFDHIILLPTITLQAFMYTFKPTIFSAFDCLSIGST